jgi:hypothetical protein
MDKDTTDNVQDEIPASDRLTTPLPQNDNPFGEPEDTPPQDQGLDDTHPATDSNIDPTEQYQEGLSGAAEASEPNQPATNEDEPEPPDTNIAS